jgi:hypothetical protein
VYSTHERGVNSCKDLVGKPKEKNHFEDLGIYGTIILKWMLKKQREDMWTGFMWLEIGTSGGLLWTR